MSKETLRRYLLTSASEASSSRTPFGETNLLSCFSQAPAPDPRTAEKDLKNVRELCTEEALQSWFDPLDIQRHPAANQVLVAFPHIFFSVRFFSLYQSVFELLARKLWGNQIGFIYGARTSNGTIPVADEKPPLPRTPVIADSRPQLSTTSQPLPEPVENFLRTPDPFLSEDSLDTDPFSPSSHGFATESPHAFFPDNPHIGRVLGLHPAVGMPPPFGEEWTFDTFISNGKHKWALGLTRDITRKAIHRATHPHTYGDSGDTPGLLVLCGPHGTGKTHLLRAAGNELFRTLGDELFYASLSDLEALFSTESPLALRQKLAAKQAILLDDFQYLARISSRVPLSDRGLLPSQEGSEALQKVYSESWAGQIALSDPQASIQEELCLLFDRFMDQGKPIILAGVGHPKDWNLGKALASRLETGLWAELPEPDLDVRLRYAQQQAKLRKISLPREHLLLLAQHCPDIRRLSGVIRRVASHRSLLGRDLSEQDLLNIIRQSGDSSALTPQLIVSIVGEHCGVPAKEILGEKRRPDLVQARQIAMYLCRELLGHSYPVIGRMFGGKDHSTVMHGVKKIKQLQERDRLVHTMLTELTKMCMERRG